MWPSLSPLSISFSNEPAGIMPFQRRAVTDIEVVDAKLAQDGVIIKTYTK